MIKSKFFRILSTVLLCLGGLLVAISAVYGLIATSKTPSVGAESPSLKSYYTTGIYPVAGMPVDGSESLYSTYINAVIPNDFGASLLNDDIVFEDTSFSFLSSHFVYSTSDSVTTFSDDSCFELYELSFNSSMFVTDTSSSYTHKTVYYNFADISTNTSSNSTERCFFFLKNYSAFVLDFDVHSPYVYSSPTYVQLSYINPKDVGSYAYIYNVPQFQEYYNYVNNAETIGDGLYTVTWYSIEWFWTMDSNGNSDWLGTFGGNPVSFQIIFPCCSPYYLSSEATATYDNTSFAEVSNVSTYYLIGDRAGVYDAGYDNGYHFGYDGGFNEGVGYAGHYYSGISADAYSAGFSAGFQRGELSIVPNPFAIIKDGLNNLFEIEIFPDFPLSFFFYIGAGILLFGIITKFLQR